MRLFFSFCGEKILPRVDFGILTFEVSAVGLYFNPLLYLVIYVLLLLKLLGNLIGVLSISGLPDHWFV